MIEKNNILKISMFVRAEKIFSGMIFTKMEKTGSVFSIVFLDKISASTEYSIFFPVSIVETNSPITLLDLSGKSVPGFPIRPKIAPKVVMKSIVSVKIPTIFFTIFFVFDCRK